MVYSKYLDKIIKVYVQLIKYVPRLDLTALIDLKILGQLWYSHRDCIL